MSDPQHQDASMPEPRHKGWTAKRLAVLWERTGGKSWEPQNPNAPAVLELIEAGYAKHVDGRCGFELMKNAMLAWTDAARSALATNTTESGQ